MSEHDKNPSGRAGKPGQLVGSWHRRGLSTDVAVPVNLERVLMLAAEDPTFRDRLLADREGALSERGIELCESERATLAAMPRPALEAVIRNLNFKRQRNTAFSKRVAVAVAGTVIVAASSFCCGGVAPDDWDQELEQDAGEPDGGTDGGSVPDAQE